MDPFHLLNKISSIIHFPGSHRRWFYGFLAGIVAISLNLVNLQPSYGQSWLDLFLRGVQILQLSNLSDNQEVRFGQQINQQLIAENHLNIAKNPYLNQYINSLGQKLAINSDRPNLVYTFQIVNNREVNAFATMGGFVYVNTGLLLKADNEAELASVFAHEIGHIVNRHALQQMRNVALSQGLMTAAGLDSNTIVQLGVQLAVNLPNSREAELEADSTGLKNLQRTGYAPYAMISFLRKLLKQGGNVPEFLSTHPATSERVTALEKAINPRTANQGDGLDNQTYRQRIKSILDS